MTPQAFAPLFITRWEDGGSTDPNRTHSLDVSDAGNWSSGVRGVGKLIGSNHGVTAYALATHRGVPLSCITLPMMRALTLGEAASIALDAYYHTPGLDKLAWNRVTASLFDFGWGAGPQTAVQTMQRLIGCDDDGSIGPATVAAFAKFTANEPWAAASWGAARTRFYDRIIAADPVKARYRDGWRNRTAWFLPGDPGGFWTKWSAA